MEYTRQDFENARMLLRSLFKAAEQVESCLPLLSDAVECYRARHAGETSAVNVEDALKKLRYAGTLDMKDEEDIFHVLTDYEKETR